MSDRYMIADLEREVVAFLNEVRAAVIDLRRRYDPPVADEAADMLMAGWPWPSCARPTASRSKSCRRAARFRPLSPGSRWAIPAPGKGFCRKAFARLAAFSISGPTGASALAAIRRRRQSPDDSKRKRSVFADFPHQLETVACVRCRCGCP